MAQPENFNRAIDADALKFIENSILTDPHQDILYKAWTPIFYIDQKVKSRLLVLTNFRLSVIKDSFPGFSLRQTFLLLNLTRISYKPASASPSIPGQPNTAQLTLTFSKDDQQATFGLQPTQHGDFIVHLPENKVKEFLWPMMFSAQSIRHGRTPIDIRLPPELLQGYNKPMPDEQDGLLAAYLAECDRCGTPRRFGVIDHFLACFQYQDHTLNLSFALKHLDAKETTKDILAIISAIKHYKWFTTILSFGIPLRDSLIAIATLFEAHTSLETLIICHAKVTQKGLQALATALATGSHQLHTVSLSDCDLDDAGLTTLCEGLAQSQVHTIQELSLSGCGFSSKGIKSLCKLFNISAFASTLRVLDISRNKIGKSGTENLCHIFTSASPTHKEMVLESLQVDNTDLDTEKFLTTLKHSQLPDTCLTTLDLSSNRFTKQSIATLCGMVAVAASLYSITLNNCNLEAKSIIEIIQAARRNQHGVEFALGFANNNIGPKGAKEFECFYTLKPMSSQEIVERRERYQMKIANHGAAASSALQGYTFYFAASTSPKEEHNQLITPINQGVPLDSIDLSDNGLGNDGIVYICRAFQVIKVKSLALDRNFKQGVFSKGNEAHIALERFILECDTLEEFSLVGDDKSYYLGQYLTGLLKALAATSLKLRYLDISGNRCGDHGILALSQYLLNNESFEELILDDNRIGFDGLNSLYLAIKQSMHYNLKLHLPVRDYDRLIKDKALSNQHQAIMQMWSDLNALLESRELERQEAEMQAASNEVELEQKMLEQSFNNTVGANNKQYQQQQQQQAQQQQQQQQQTITSTAAPTTSAGPQGQPPPPGSRSAAHDLQNFQYGRAKQHLPPPPSLSAAAQQPQAIAIDTNKAQFDIKLTTQSIAVPEANKNINNNGPDDNNMPPPPLPGGNNNDDNMPPSHAMAGGRRGTINGKPQRRASIIQQRTLRFQLGGGSQQDVTNAHSASARQAQQHNFDYNQRELDSFDAQQQHTAVQQSMLNNEQHTQYHQQISSPPLPPNGTAPGYHSYNNGAGHIVGLTNPSTTSYQSSNSTTSSVGGGGSNYPSSPPTPNEGVIRPVPGYQPPIHSEKAHVQQSAINNTAPPPAAPTTNNGVHIPPAPTTMAPPPPGGVKRVVTFHRGPKA